MCQLKTVSEDNGNIFEDKQ